MRAQRGRRSRKRLEEQAHTQKPPTNCSPRSVIRNPSARRPSLRAVAMGEAPHLLPFHNTPTHI